MKKILYLLTFLFAFVPGLVFGYGIDNYKMDITVLENGDLQVKEAFSLNGDYNGFERIIDFKSEYTSIFGSSLSPTGDAEIYNGSGIILKSIKGINFSLDKSLSQITGDEFKKTTSAQAGDYGVYTVKNKNTGAVYKIFNPNGNNKDFYIEYILSGMAINYDDLSEVGLNIFTSLNESIGKLEIDVHIPNNKNLLRVWGHGTESGNIKIIDNQNFNLTITNIDALQALDTRFVFDRDVVNSTKKVSQTVLDRIIEIETKLADDTNNAIDNQRRSDAIYYANIFKSNPNNSNYDAALFYINRLRDDDGLKTELLNQTNDIYKEYLYKTNIKSAVFFSIKLIWLVGLGYLCIKFYNKHDKERNSVYKDKYFRDFPADYPPSSVGYLLRRGINNDDLSACILNLINKKAIKFEEIDKKNYKLIKCDDIVLSDTESKLMKLLFDKESETTLKEFQSRAKKQYSHFLDLYDDWKTWAERDAVAEGFYENNRKAKNGFITGYIFIGIIVLMLSFVLAITVFDIATTVLFLFLGFVALAYIQSSSKRTEKGNDDYYKWLGLKKFMQDFGRMNEKELPHISLWEKYLVYAVTLGCADKLADVMKVKFAELQERNLDPNLFDYYRFNRIMYMNNQLNRTVGNAVSAARSAQSAANSSNYSSGGGFGGGFSGGSSGGGSFGGGGGGGRF